jgi:predicted nucleic acid-binding protein
MNLYVDSSVLLRIVLAERGELREFRKSTTWVSSALTRVECLRTIDRARVQLRLSDDEVAARRVALREHLRRFDLVQLDGAILELAAEPFPTALGSLDAIHLASAMAARRRWPDLVLATHDRELSIAARATGFEVLGVAAAR